MPIPSDPADAPLPSPTLSPTVAALAVFCCLLWAGAYVTGKIAISGTNGTGGFGPFRAAFFRFAVAGVLLAAWQLGRNPRTALRVHKTDWLQFGRLGLLGIGLTYVFNYGGLALSSGTAAALIMATEPVWIAILAVLFLREKMTPPRFVGIVAGLVGAVLVVLSTQKPNAAAGTTGGGEAMLGNMLMVLSLLWEAGAVLTVKRLAARYKGVEIVTIEFLIGALCLAPFASWETTHSGPIAPGLPAWAAFTYLLTGCTLVAYTIWFNLLAVADASDITIFIFLQPVVGTLIGVAWLHDPFSRLTLVGAVLVLVGVLCITTASQQKG